MVKHIQTNVVEAKPLLPINIDAFYGMSIERHRNIQNDTNERDTLLAAIRRWPGCDLYTFTEWNDDGLDSSGSMCEEPKEPDDKVVSQLPNSIDWHQVLDEGTAILAAIQIVDRGGARRCRRKQSIE